MPRRKKQPNPPNEIEQATEDLKKAQGVTEAYRRLNLNTDFQIFLREILILRESYRDLIENPMEDTKLDTVRGGLIAIRDILGKFKSTKDRSADLAAKLAELQGGEDW